MNSASDTNTGMLTVDMSDAVRNNISIEFDAIDHSKALGQQYFNFTIQNSEETIVDFQVHPYSDDVSAKGIVVCGETIADGNAVRIAWGSVGTHHIKTDIDYHAGKVTVTVGATEFTAQIPEGTVKDLKKLEISSTRSKTAGDRYISVDNLRIAEFNSTEPPAQVTVTEGYETAAIADYNCQVKANSGMSAVIYLASELRAGTDTYSQLYDAKPVFDILGGKATLVAPQTNGLFTDVSALVSAIRSQYNAPSVTVIGQSKNAAAALSSGADKIITIAGTGTDKPSGKVWVFAGCTDEITPVSDVKAMVNTLQTSGVNTLYTEYPYEGHKLNSAVAGEAGLADWILSDNNEGKTVDLAIFMGQSNMAGRGDYEEAVKCIPGHGFEYHAVTEPGVLSTVSEPFGKYENNDTVNDNSGSGADRRSGDMVSAFMESYYQASGVPIVGVQCSRGGTESKWWSGAVLTEAAARYNEAKKYLEDSGYTIGKQFMVWCQGCSDADANRSIEAYKSNTKTIFETMKSNTGLTDMFMVRIGHCKTSGAAAIDEVKDLRYRAVNIAQRELAASEENITAVASFYTDEYAALMRDQYHYYQEAYNSVGTTAGNNTAYTLYNKGTWTAYPEPENGKEEEDIPVEEFEITSSETEIDVSSLKNYDNSTYRLYKTDGSYETVTALNGKAANTTGGEVTVVPEYRFEFTSQTSPTDTYIKDYVKVGADSYSKDKGYGLLEGGDYSINENGCKCLDSPIMVDLAKGFYDITVYRKGGARADIYSNGMLIANNTTSASPQNRNTSYAVMEIPAVKVNNNGINLTFGNVSGTSERIASVKIARVPEKYRKSVVWVAGDSESANYYAIDAEGNDLDSNKIMMTGFGMQLSKVLSDKYAVSNYGQPSATVKTWYDECFSSVENLMQSGDTIIIDFGINDAISSSNKITVDEMKQYMKTMIDAARAKGVTPIIVSPVYNGKYQHRTYFTYDAASDTNAMYDFAKECGAGCIDLNKWTQAYVNKAIADTGDENWSTNNYHIADNLHLTQHSALLAASFIAAGMSEMGYEVSDYSYTYKDISEVAEGNTRGSETGEAREYGAAAARKFMGIEEAPEDGLTIKYDSAAGKVTVEGKNGDITRGTLIKALYDGDALKSIEVQSIDFAQGAQAAPEKGMKLYLWRSLNGMEPLAKVYEYKGEDITASPSPIPTPTPTPTAAPTAIPEEPKEIIYKEDFEGYNTGNKAGWTSLAGTMSVKSDSTDGIGKYQTVVSRKSGTCRSGYIELPSSVTENFVFECDYKSTSNVNVSDLELLESRYSVYSNHGVYSNENFVFTMARPKGSDCYVINNKSDDSGFNLDSYADPIFKTQDITDNPWLHIKVVGDMMEYNIKNIKIGIDILYKI